MLFLIKFGFDGIAHFWQGRLRIHPTPRGHLFWKKKFSPKLEIAFVWCIPEGFTESFFDSHGSIFFYSTSKLAFFLTKSIMCSVISECQVGQFLKKAQMAPIVCNFIWNVKLNRSSETNSVSLYVSPIIDIVRNRVKIKKVA